MNFIIEVKMQAGLCELPLELIVNTCNKAINNARAQVSQLPQKCLKTH